MQEIGWRTTFFWIVGLAFQPHLENFRRKMTKLGVIITTIDDIYNVYGALEELGLFTYVVDMLAIYYLSNLFSFYTFLKLRN